MQWLPDFIKIACLIIRTLLLANFTCCKSFPDV